MSRHHPPRRSRASLLALAAFLVTGPLLLTASPAGAAPAGSGGQPDVVGAPGAAAVAVPDVPTGVTASGDDESLTVSWTAPSAEGGSPTSYTVTAGVWRAGVESDTVSVTVPGAVTTTRVTGLVRSSIYRVSVTAANEVGPGYPSVPLTTHTTGGAVPDPPSSVTASPLPGSVLVSWPVPAGNGYPIDSYTLRAYASGSAVPQPVRYEVLLESPGRAAWVRDLTQGTAYTFTVTATNAAGESRQSAPTSPVAPGAGEPTPPWAPQPVPVPSGPLLSGGAIGEAYEAAGGSAGPLGGVLGQETCGELPEDGCYQEFQGGTMYWTPTTGAHWLTGPVEDRWLDDDDAFDQLGFPVTDQVTLRDGAVAHFEGGSLYWSPGTGAHLVRGAIRDRWAALGWQDGTLGYPTADEVALRGGAVTHFQGGSVYWSPATGAHAVRGAIRDRWAALGWQDGTLGYPTTDEVGLGGGAVTHFQGGSVYWSPATGAHAVRGAIRDKWASQRWQGGPLGYPTTDEVVLAGGAVTHFQGGSVYWSPATGAHVVKGAVRDRWASLGWQDGVLGYPLTDETLLRPSTTNVVVHFQGGSIYFTPFTGAHAVWGAIRDRWASMGWQDSVLSYPTSEEYDVPGGRRSDFRFGSITWTPAKGAVSSR
ncbi:fibronectin type III domain-containing protein [Modestobacter sp. L9-4]|uniref:fibronectin type III domain-containing protein n=1 Tax=Modestobacter sp. L9-4 TaxID=2851567 RepID=UPI001C76EA79|nr:fibronectin type III domain-containing protein [Modestobacter sp. L9-4]QXG77193.1 fibronectin type III domain-containing protein [Modestobacter sp. L9-4]